MSIISVDKLVKRFGKNTVLYDEVVKLISDGAKEIVANYDVDELHIDDYFYPTTDASFDSDAFKASGYKTLSDFRFANCDKMVKSLYSAVKLCFSATEAYLHRALMLRRRWTTEFLHLKRF